MIPIVNQLVENFKEENRLEVKKFYFELKEKLDTLNKLDEQIFDLVSAKEDGDVEKEVNDAYLELNLCGLNYQNWKPRLLTEKHTNGKSFGTVTRVL